MRVGVSGDNRAMSAKGLPIFEKRHPERSEGSSGIFASDVTAKLLLDSSLRSE
jgi:hypothetical protein